VEDTCCLAHNSFVFASNVIATVVPSAYTHIQTQDVSEKGGHILNTWSVDQNKEKFSKTCFRRRSSFIMITSGINPHEDNSLFRRQYQWSAITGLLLPLSNSCNIHANLSQHAVQHNAAFLILRYLKWSCCETKRPRTHVRSFSFALVHRAHIWNKPAYLRNTLYVFSAQTAEKQRWTTNFALVTVKVPYPPSIKQKTWQASDVITAKKWNLSN